MAFIVKKKISGKEYFYLRESKREKTKDGKKGRVIAKTIAYLGKTRTEAEKKMNEILGLDVKKENNNIKKARNEGITMSDKKEMKQSENKIENKSEISIDEMTNFCKRKGFVYASGELYGGLSGFWDFGPYGSEMKKNLKDAWWRYHIQSREDIVGIDGSIITNPKVWKASGHVDSFVDVAVVCKKCKNKSKVDKFELKKGDARCEKCGGEWEDKGEFNPMFTTLVGPIKSDAIEAYLRPETAQLIFADFKQVVENARLKLPFGIAQMGKSFRNEIAPRNFLFRSREFEQMEIEYFIDPDKKDDCPYIKDVEDFELNIYSADMQKNGKDAERMKIHEALKKGIIKLGWHGYWLATETKFFLMLGANPDKLRVRQHMAEERSHYATDTWDVQYKFPFGWQELQGVADRGTYDLSQHEKFSGKDLKIVDESGVEQGQKPRKILPMVVAEPSLGVERAFLVFMFDAYTFDEKRQNIVLKLNPKLAPIKAAIFPLVKNDKVLVKMSREVYETLREEWNVLYDESGSVGRRYARNDEIGTPYCVTIDSDSFAGKDVTIRDRDSTKQIRVKIADLRDVFRKMISGELKFEKAGKMVETRVKGEDVCE
ncbi:MAG: glycine--tRNA ligase [archaeon]